MCIHTYNAISQLFWVCTCEARAAHMIYTCIYIYIYIYMYVYIERERERDRYVDVDIGIEIRKS